MAIYIISGNYTLEGVRGLVQHPSDREAAVKPLIAAAGGKILSYYVTLGDHDFQMVVDAGTDTEAFMAALIVAGASGGVSNLKTVQAFTAAEFMASQKRAAAMAASFKAPNQG